MGKLAVPREVVIKHAQKSDYGTFNGKPASAYLGLMQNRRVVNFTFSQKLEAYRACVAGKLKNSKPGNFGGVLTAFVNAAKDCKSAVANIPSGGRKRYSGSYFLGLETRRKRRGAAA